MSALIDIVESLERIECGECGILFAVPRTWLSARRDSGEQGGSFHCPNGHSRVYREPEVMKLRKQLEQKQRDIDFANAALERSRESLKAQRTQTTRFKNKLEKTKRRVGHGICPCCNRTFKQLVAHMKAKHPKYADDKEPELGP